jgi:hypothetical protein
VIRRSEANLIAVYAMLFPVLAWRAVVAAYLWQWHAVPFGLPRLGWATWLAALLLRVVALRSSTASATPITAAEVVALAFLDACCLAVGWCLS